MAKWQHQPTLPSLNWQSKRWGSGCCSAAVPPSAPSRSHMPCKDKGEETVSIEFNGTKRKSRSHRRNPGKCSADPETPSPTLWNQRHLGKCGKIQQISIECPMTVLILLCEVHGLVVRGLWGRQSCKSEELFLITVALLRGSTLREGYPTAGSALNWKETLQWEKKGNANVSPTREKRRGLASGKWNLRKKGVFPQGVRREKGIQNSSWLQQRVVPDTGQGRNRHQTLFLGAEKVCQLGPRTLFSSFSSLSGKVHNHGSPCYAFPQDNQYARGGKHKGSLQSTGT